MNQLVLMVRPAVVIFKRLLILVANIVFVLFLYFALIPIAYRDINKLVGITLAYGVTAYFVIPKIHRLLQSLYTPPFILGRTRTQDGILADPINIGLVGTREEITDCMSRAGWHEADPRVLKNSLRSAYSVLLKQSYPNAPVSDLYLYGRKQDLVFQQAVAGTPRKRHHVRFWKVDKSQASGKIPTNLWLGAATYDNDISFSFFTGQITHTIAPDTDAERDYIISTLRESMLIKKLHEIKQYVPAYEHWNGDGRKFFTNGSLKIAELKKSR